MSEKQETIVMCILSDEGEACDPKCPRFKTCWFGKEYDKVENGNNARN